MGRLEILFVSGRMKLGIQLLEIELEPLRIEHMNEPVLVGGAGGVHDNQL